MYNYNKYKNLPLKEQAIIRNEFNRDNKNNSKVETEISSKKNEESQIVIRSIHRNIMVAMKSTMSLPASHLETFETIWFTLKEKIEDFSGKKNLNQKTKKLIEELLSSNAYKETKKIDSQQSLGSRLGEFSSIAEKYLK